MTMTRDNLKRVRELCEQVEGLIVEVKAEMDAEERARAEKWPQWLVHSACGSPTTGALRRRSMDLSRALSELRR